jgi:tRNA threonylcarbamoyladenosine biosynthesis protein TsaB
VLILGLDTATRSTAAALLSSDPRPFELEARDDPPPGTRPRHATKLLELVSEVFERSGVGWDAVDRIAVGVGPGTFTGLRIGVASARALARARRIELVGVSTLQALAFNAASPAVAADADALLAVLDARRGEVFAAGWKTTGQARGDAELVAPGAYTPDRLAAVVDELGLASLAIGDGAVEFRAVLERAGALIPGDRSELHRVSAIAHCRLALSMRASSPDQVHPAYLRLPDAEISRRAASKQ